MINNRQNGNGRRRGRSGNAPRPNGGQPERGSRLDNRARGNASQLHEKYKTLAADMQRQGDRVMTEYYLQFADHYFRVLSESRSRFDEQQQQQQRRDRYDGQADEDDEADGGDTGDWYDERPAERGQRAQETDRGEPDGQRDVSRDTQRESGRDGQRDGQRDVQRDNGRENQRDAGRDGQRDGSREGQRETARDNQRERGRNDRDRVDGNRGDGNRAEANRADGNRNDGNRYEGGRGEVMRGLEGPRVDQPRERGEERDYRQPREPRAPRDGFEPRQQRARRGEQVDGERVGRDVANTAAAAPEPIVTAPDTTPELPLDAPVAERRPRGRPRKVAVPAENPGEASERIEMDRLPPSLSAEPSGSDDRGEEAPKPRRTRRPRGEAATA